MERENREKGANLLAAAVERVEERIGEALGEAVGDFVGEAAGEAVGVALGETAGELVGAAAGPVGALAGGLVGLAAGKALDAALRPEKTEESEESAKAGDLEEPEGASGRKIAGSVAALVVAEAGALGFDVEKWGAALRLWKETSSATAALSGVGRWAASEARDGCERLRGGGSGERKRDETENEGTA